MADIKGRKNTYITGIGIFVIASAMCSFAPSVPFLIGTRILQAVGASTMYGNSVALVSSFFGPSERGRALGILSAATYSGLSLGASVGGFLIQYLGWRSVFYVNVPVGIVVILIALFVIHGDMPVEKMQKFDARGSALWAGAISLSLFGVSTLYSYGYIALPSIVAGLSVLAIFVLLESKMKQPLLDLKLLKNRLFTFSVSTAFLNYASTYGIGLCMSLFLRLGLGYTPSFAGLILLAQPIVMVVASPVGGYIADRVEPRYQVSTSLAIMCVSILSLATLNSSATPIGIVVRLAFLGLGLGSFTSANTNAIMGTVTRFQYGVASGIQSTMRYLGQAVSLAMVTAILTATLHENASSSTALVLVPPNVIIDGVRVALIILAIMNGIGILTSLSRGRKNEPAAVQTKTPGPD